MDSLIGYRYTCFSYDLTSVDSKSEGIPHIIIIQSTYVYNGVRFLEIEIQNATKIIQVVLFEEQIQNRFVSKLENNAQYYFQFMPNYEKGICGFLLTKNDSKAIYKKAHFKLE